jgi:pimeloyl-ACP methyl ester carboxylesterase
MPGKLVICERIAEQQIVMNSKTRTVQVNGTSLNVYIEGEGPDVLLVHGFPDCHTVWREQIPALVKAGYRVIAPDTRGCGDSAVPSRVSDYKVTELVADLVGLLDALKIDRVKLVAHDWGAVIAWNFVVQHPERVERYVALSVGHIAAYARGGLLQKLKGYYVLLIQLRWVAEFLLTRFDWLGFRLMTRYPEEMDNWRRTLGRPGRLTAALNYYRANLGMFFQRNFPPVTVTVLGIWGSGDVALAERQMLETEKYVEAPFQYRSIEGAGHWVQLDAPGEVNRILLEYLETRSE